MDNTELETILRSTSATIEKSNPDMHACLRVLLGSMNDGSTSELVHYLRIFATYRLVECGKALDQEEVEDGIAKLFGWDK